MVNIENLPFVLRNPRPAYFGILVPQVWIFCVVHRVDTDYAGVNISIPLYVALSLCMVATLMITIRPNSAPHPPLAQSRPARFVIALIMAVATFFLIYPLNLNPALIAACACIGGVGLALLYLDWVQFYAAIDIKDSIACVFVAMAVGSACKAFIDLMPALFAALCLMALPFVSVTLAPRAAACAPEANAAPTVYFDSKAASVPWGVLVGIGVYSLIIGMLQGMPLMAEGQAVSFEARMLVLHAAEILVALAVLWWVFGRRGLLRFSSLWRAVVLFTATGAFFIPVLTDTGIAWALTLISIAQTLVVMLFWVMLADVARHSSVSPYAVYGAGWIAYSLPLAVGQAIGSAIGTQGSAGSYALAIAAWLLTIAAVFALNENDIAQRRIFADLNEPVPKQSLYADIEASCARLGKTHGLTAREIEVMTLICKGRSKAYIAETLFISDNTVRSHAKHLYQKLGVHSKQELLDLVSPTK